MNILKSARQAPTTNAIQIGSTKIPSTIFDAINTETEINIQCKIIFIPLEAGRGHQTDDSDLLN